ncbi:DUF4145 domain-containing protein [Pseudanabaena galeata UHCC 0370]|uniref:DUF4145 domain-containing protein n=1 Tax=Pseudanabaena galeata UHCC 0370 TaxID=3110310 RepID=A0ABU5TR31_9CYAN|nr:DUF4145 domain-containing protein [Pseudanabaena galeata]MEA5479953.1 DUF4145 domain-containing protein [Pseudanabaena galeata UHCC 0370]
MSSEEGTTLELAEWAEYPKEGMQNDCNSVCRYSLWSCRGCDTATLQESWALKVTVKKNTNQAFWAYTFHPKRSENNCLRKVFLSLPPDLCCIYDEIIHSFNSELQILTSIGLRALLEGICVDQGITDKDARGLKGKLQELDKRKHLPSSIISGLDSFKYIGDNAAHRLERTKMEDLRLAIEVMEDLLNFLYSLDAKANYLFRTLNDQDLS